MLYVIMSRYCRVSTVLLPASATALLSQEISALALDSSSSSQPPGSPLQLVPPSQPATPLLLPTGQPATPLLPPSQPATPLLPPSQPATPLFSRRASFFTSSRPPSATLPASATAAELRGRLLRTFGNDSLTLMSPLRPPTAVVDLSCAAVTSLRSAGSVGDYGGRAATILGYISGHLMRLVLPPLATSLVGRALAAVKQLLPRELALQLHGAWYSARHAPGPGLGPAEEWRLFCKCLLALAGYQVAVRFWFCLKG